MKRIISILVYYTSIHINTVTCPSEIQHLENTTPLTPPMPNDVYLPTTDLNTRYG